MMPAQIDRVYLVASLPGQDPVPASLRPATDLVLPVSKRVVAKPPINSSPVYGKGAETKTEPVSKT